MNKTPIIKLLLFFIVCGFYACQEHIYMDEEFSESRILKTKSIEVWDVESLIDMAMLDYPIQ